jgi:hypothetical protein
MATDNTDKFMAVERARMHAIFVQALDEERRRTPSRDIAHVQTAGIMHEFPRLSPEEVAELTLEEFVANWHVVPGQDPYTTPQQTNWIIWFTDEAGARRLRELQP